jgi:hypothetical protein
MGMSFAEPLEVDDAFVKGPETVVQAASVIVAGPISHGSKQVERYSQPGPNGFPLEWTFTGQLEHPTVLKGERLPEPIQFSKREISVFVPLSDSSPGWERSYGELSPNGRVVLFFGQGQPATMTEAVPSGSGEQDLITLVRDVVAIQAINKPGVQVRRWMDYVKTTLSDQGRKAALRSLVHSDIQWPEFESVVMSLLENPLYSRDIRAFTFAIIAFSLRQRHWHASTLDAVDRLCKVFADETETRLALQYILSLKVLLRYYDADRDLGPRVRQKIMSGLASRQSRGLVDDPDLREQYRQIGHPATPGAP